ncbi:glycosyltransferase family 28 C-terminal domain-containing protein [Pavlovales sp. CCMP2436]|nr:glycosyltransferase family 28 C-terminal domain-containing protein [Pavlovales sp. CCMP2436]
MAVRDDLAIGRQDKLVFVTVGTTQFDALVGALVTPPLLAALGRMGFHRLRIQHGRGMPPGDAPAGCGVRVEAYAFKLSLAADMDEADLVISHAGSGSILEALGRRKPLLVVVNEALMDNHQAELADELHARGHLVATRCDGLGRALDDWGSLGVLLPLPVAQPAPFCACVDALLGVSGTREREIR